MIIPHRLLKPVTGNLGAKLLITIFLFLVLIQFYLITHSQSQHSIRSASEGLGLHRTPTLISYGGSSCLPQVDQQLAETAIAKHAVCKKHSPFAATNLRIAIASGHFGKQEQFYRDALRSHISYSFIHGSETFVMCSSMVDGLWNKPAFLLSLIMQEMMKPETERLEWILWLDRDTIILDECRPVASFLPPARQHRDRHKRRSEDSNANLTSEQPNLLVNNDMNGLNNGVFVVRVNDWAVQLFNAILAFRHYKPEVELKFTEQSAMEEVLKMTAFKRHTQYVPQHWFNGYSDGGSEDFRDRKNDAELNEETVRRGDYLVHFAGNPHKDEAIRGWLDMLNELPNIWKTKTVQRDVSREIAGHWKELGF